MPVLPIRIEYCSFLWDVEEIILYFLHIGFTGTYKGLDFVLVSLLVAYHKGFIVCSIYLVQISF